jgi:hypothetical protein
VVVKAGVVDEEVAPNIVLVLIFVDEVVGFALFPKVVLLEDNEVVIVVCVITEIILKMIHKQMILNG